MAAAAIPLAVVGGGLNAFGSVMAGREQSRAANFEASNLDTQAAELDRQSQEYQIAGAQTEARRREELTSSLETIMAIRAGRGVGEFSPTASAIYDSTLSDERRDVRTERYNYLSKAEQARLSARNANLSAGLARKKAKTSLLAGYVNAAGDIVGAGMNIQQARAPRVA
jgi:hypothetical protein